jgi:hypothetical protein
MTTIGPELEIFSIGTPQHFRHVTVFPLLHPAPRDPFYLTLDEALAQGCVQVTEVSKGGRVPELRLVNRGDLPILLLDGEELVGAKQNRVLNLTILAPAQSEVVIPVSCVEQGRWSEASADFCASPRVHFAAGRAAKVASVSERLAEGQGAVSDQSEVWHNIAGKAARMNLRSETGAMADLFHHAGQDIEAYVQAFSATPGQAGAIFALGGRVVGLEVLFSPDTFAKLLPKLIRSYALDAIEIPGDHSPLPPADSAVSFLRQVAAAEVREFPAVGLGKTLRLQTNGIVGVGLWAEEALVHLAAFRHQGPGGRTPSGVGLGMRRASWRFRGDIC